MLIDKTGNILFKIQHRFERPYYSKVPGWAEQKPEVYWETVCDITKRLKAEASEAWGGIVAVAVTTIRDTCLCVDRDGRPLRDAYCG
jgi:sugar (pentulose or hexulose) kinase